MADLPSIPHRIQIEESRFRSPVSESTAQKFGETNNYLLDHFPVREGTIHAFAGPETNVPSGYIVCDGRAVSRTTYSLLFAAIGIAWGQGDGFTTFNVPDLRGMFLRMVNTTTVGNSGRDPDASTRVAIATGGNVGDNPGSYQADQVIDHAHQYAGGANPPHTSNTAFFYPADVFTGFEFTTSSVGGNETRPKNAYILYMIKY